MGRNTLGHPAPVIVQHHENKRVQPPRVSRGWQQVSVSAVYPGEDKQWSASRAGGRSRLHTATGEAPGQISLLPGPHHSGVPRGGESTAPPAVRTPALRAGTAFLSQTTLSSWETGPFLAVNCPHCADCRTSGNTVPRARAAPHPDGHLPSRHKGTALLPLQSPRQCPHSVASQC